MKTIELFCGLVAKVDDEDYERLRGLPWHRVAISQGHVYAGTRNGELMHRIILGLPKGRNPVVDHENGDGLDNQRHNLRKATFGQNLANSSRRSKSGFRGVREAKGGKTYKWVAQASAGTGRTVSLGCFETPEEAARAYDAHARARFGEFARTNFPA